MRITAAGFLLLASLRSDELASAFLHGTCEKIRVAGDNSGQHVKLIVPPHIKCGTPAAGGGVCAAGWGCDACKKGADGPTDCLTCTNGYTMKDVNSEDCTCSCTAIPPADENRLFMLSPRYAFTGKPLWTRQKTAGGPLEYLYYIESSMLSAWCIGSTNGHVQMYLPVRASIHVGN
jgi:hypothetical protein